jgi:hypothetical protein
MNLPGLDPAINRLLQQGTVIPAHPLALTEHRQLDEKRQRLLTQYYIASGAGGVAVGVHTTQFEIRRPEINLLKSVLEIAASEIEKSVHDRPFIKVAGVVGPTHQALQEAKLAADIGYDLALVSMGGLKDYSERQLIDRCYAIAQIIPVFGFYLQPAVGGRLLTFDFWKNFVAIPNVYAIKVAAFNRYQTLDVVRAVCGSDRAQEIALYTGNDDNIVADLLTPFRFTVNNKEVEKRFVGGLLGHWAMWTKSAVRLLDEIKSTLKKNDGLIMEDLLAANVKVTDMNAAIFDPSHTFHGCIPGIHEVLRRQGLLAGRWCLNPEETLSPGQLDEIDRVCLQYPELTDDEFVKKFLQTQKMHMA